MQWVLASSFPVGGDWIFGRISSRYHRFTPIEPHYRHDRSRRGASLRDWLDYLVQAARAWWCATRLGSSVGIVTVFPQLAVLVGVLKRLTRSRRPVVAMMFNLGRTHGGLQGALARFGLQAVDRFVVHSTHEIGVYSEWLSLPAERFVFVPLSVDQKAVTVDEDVEQPFVLSMGSANRDYTVLMRALEATGIPAIVVAGPHALEGVAVPPTVNVLSGLSIDACHGLCQRARVSIVPLRAADTAAGQVSVLEAMMFGKPVVATRSVGTVDYIRDGVDGLLVAEGDAEALSGAIARLWADEPLRTGIGAAARRSALARYTFEAVSHRVESILNALVPESAQRAEVAPADGPGLSR